MPRMAGDGIIKVRMKPAESMNTRISPVAFLVFAVAAILSLPACGGGSGSGGSVLVKAVNITPTAATVQINTAFDITANVTLTNSSTTTNTAVTWQVNGVGGGSASLGTIVSSTSDPQVGVYTAPAVVPTDNDGQVTITAVAPQNPSDSTDTNTVTSNSAIITVGIGEGLAVQPTIATVPAGGTFQFSAFLNSVADPNATWTVTSTNGGNIGSINPITGLYTAPAYPPPGAKLTITATDPATTTPATATATIVYSDASLSGPFAFSYTGNDESGFATVAGSFVADGSGHIVSGVEDIDSFTTGGWVEYQLTGTYKVGPDGRASAVLNTGSVGAATWQFALTTNQHALMIRFDRNFTGSGTMDQQDLDDLSSSLLLVDGPYVFGVSGSDPAFHPMAIAGKFTSNGSGSIPMANTVLDLNDNGTVTASDTSLHGSYAFDPTEPDTGRGTITLTGTSTGSLEYAFYIIDSTHLHLVEIDDVNYLAGDMLIGAAPGSLATANYVFTTGGTSPTGAYGSGGVFAAGASNAISGGVFDSNNAGTVTLKTALGTCTYTVDSGTGRIDLRLFLGSGACPAGPGSTISEFAVYPTAQTPSSAIMLELDSSAVSTGLAYEQQVLTEPGAGGFALNIAGQGTFHNAPASYQQDVEGQLTFTSTVITGGNLDINNFNAGFQTDPIDTTTSSITAPDSTTGRGTAVLVATNPNVSYNLVYYIIDDNTALLLDSDATRILVGKFARQY
jgi:hypothetical protein